MERKENKWKWKENERKINGNERKINGNERKWKENGRKMNGNERKRTHAFEYLTFILRKAVSKFDMKIVNFSSVFDIRRPFRAEGFKFVKKKNAIFPQFLTFDVHFVRKGLKSTPRNRNFSSVFDVRRPFRAKGLPRTIEIAIEFLTFDVHFVRKGYVSWRSGGTALRLRRKKEEREGDIQWEREEICRHVKM